MSLKIFIFFVICKHKTDFMSAEILKHWVFINQQANYLKGYFYVVPYGVSSWRVEERKVGLGFVVETITGHKT